MPTSRSLTVLQEELQETLTTLYSYCKSSKETVAVAESVTSGCLQLILSTAEGAGDFFQGGITAYNCAQKAIHLGIEPIHADSCNGVDPAIALQMAHHACTLFRSQIGIGITGYATKVPEENINRLFAHVAIVRNSEVLYTGEITPVSEGIDAQWEYADAVLRRLSSLLTSTM